MLIDTYLPQAFRRVQQSVVTIGPIIAERVILQFVDWFEFQYELDISKVFWHNPRGFYILLILFKKSWGWLSSKRQQRTFCDSFDLICSYILNGKVTSTRRSKIRSVMFVQKLGENNISMTVIIILVMVESFF